MDWEDIIKDRTFQRVLASVLATLAECLIEEHRREAYERRYGEQQQPGGGRYPGERYVNGRHAGGEEWR